MLIPENIRYTKNHEWIRVEGNQGYVGITDYAQTELGDIVFVEIETVNELLEKEEVFGTIEAVKTVYDMFIPVTGKVLKVNPTLEDHPEIVNQDPYGEGWMIQISIENSSELEQLLSATQYKELINEH